MGNEGLGLRFSMQKICDYLVKLPMHGEMSSLNILVAAATSIYEVCRQRKNF